MQGGWNGRPPEQAARPRATRALPRAASRLIRTTLAGRLEQLDRIAVRVFQLDLPAARPFFQLVAQTQAALLDLSDDLRQLLDAKDYAVPAAGLLAAAIRQRPRARCTGTAQQQMQAAERHVGKRRELLMLQLETQLLDVKRHGTRDVRHLIADAVKFCLLQHVARTCRSREGFVGGSLPSNCAAPLRALAGRRQRWQASPDRVRLDQR